MVQLILERREFCIAFILVHTAWAVVGCDSAKTTLKIEVKKPPYNNYVTAKKYVAAYPTVPIGCTHDNYVLGRASFEPDPSSARCVTVFVGASNGLPPSEMTIESILRISRGIVAKRVDFFKKLVRSKRRIERNAQVDKETIEYRNVVKRLNYQIKKILAGECSTILIELNISGARNQIEQSIQRIDRHDNVIKVIRGCYM